MGDYKNFIILDTINEKQPTNFAGCLLKVFNKQDADSIVKDKFNAHLHGMRALASG